ARERPMPREAPVISTRLPCSSMADLPFVRTLPTPLGFGRVIHLEDRGLVALVTIDRAERRNALDHEALEQLLEALHGSRSAPVLVLTGAGGHFCAGADLSGVEDSTFTDLLR